MDDQRFTTIPPTVRHRRPAWPWLVLLLVLIAVAVVVVRLGGTAGGGRHAQSQPPQAVGVAATGLADMEVADSGLGTVTSLASVTVQTQISGTLQALGFREGQVVQKGDFLAQIDPRPYQALLAQARGALAHDQGLLRQAQTDARRYALLQRQDSISRQQAEDQLFVVQQYEGSVATDEGMIQTQMVNLAFCHIVAPVSGRVGLRQVDAGNYVTPTSLANGIVVVTQLDPISALFTLPEDDVPAIQAQLAAGATLSVEAYDRSNTTRLATGRLETLDNQIDVTTGTVKLRALFDNPKLALFPNQFVNLRLIVRTLHQVVTVPNAAVQTGAPGSFVYLVQTGAAAGHAPADPAALGTAAPGNAGTAAQSPAGAAPEGGQDHGKGGATVAVRAVKLGVVDALRSQVIDGLAVGDRVVVDGADRLRDGAPVTLPGASGAQPADQEGQGHHHRHRTDPQP